MQNIEIFERQSQVVLGVTDGRTEYPYTTFSVIPLFGIIRFRKM